MNADLGLAVPHSPLFPRGEERRAWDDALTGALAGARARMSRGSVVPTIDRGAFAAQLARFDFRAPQPLDEIVPWVIDQLEHGIVHQTHPRYFGLFNPCPSAPAELAERIVAAFNPQLASATTSPVPVAIERHVIGAVAARAGLPSGCGGHFTTGGSEANFTALVCALTAADPRFAQHGARGLERSPVVYLSEAAHLAWLKIAHQAGIGRAAVRLVGPDASGRMDAGLLEDSIRADRTAGRQPVMVVATAGTTAAGMIDPLPECAAIARAAGAWFHVDAAWGGALIASDRLRGMLDGIGAAESVTIDAHKWLSTTMGCGMFLTPRADVLAAAFHATADYMPSRDGAGDPYLTTVQWSRRFLGLRLFMALARFGWQGFAAHIERAVGLADELRTALAADGWDVLDDDRMAVVCAVPPPGAPAAAHIARAVVASGRAWVATAQVCGREVMRACITNGLTGPGDVRALVRQLREVCRGGEPARAAEAHMTEH